MNDICIEREGRQFGLEDRVRVRAPNYGENPGVVLHELDAAIWLFPVLRCRLWALRHGYGWLPVRAG